MPFLNGFRKAIQMTLGNLEMEGVVHGKYIKLTTHVGFPDRQRVVLTVSRVPSEGTRIPGDGLRRAFAAWADDAEDLDKYLDWNRQQRKNE